jgi:hypothetical protein
MKQSLGQGKAERASRVIRKRAVAFRLTIASSIFHASRLRRSTRFDTALICANGTSYIRHAAMNAAPSMLSTCGLQRSTIAAMERSLPCTVFTVIPVTVGS